MLSFILIDHSNYQKNKYDRLFLKKVSIILLLQKTGYLSCLYFAYFSVVLGEITHLKA